MKHLLPKEAHELLQKNPDALFIDVRSEMEFLFVGHPKDSLLVPWNDGPDWDVNPHFVGEVKKLIGSASDRPVVLICRSGKRSAEAGEELMAHGIKHVFNVTHGFEGDIDDVHHRGTVNGWRFDGLPWEQC
jgi:rhodanese-related sulfurtransferase